MNVGYIRLSTADQEEHLQRDALQAAGCEQIFHDIVSGAKMERKRLNSALAYLRPGDTLVVWKLDRAGRSLKHLIELVNSLQERKVDFISLTEKIDTTTPGGKLIFHVMGALAEFERDLIRERTRAGLTAARARGRKGGRPRKLKTDSKIALARRMFADKENTMEQICSLLGISRATLYRYLSRDQNHS